MARFHALILLAWALVRSLLSPFLGTRRGLSAFRASYAADRLPPIRADERKLVPHMSGCLACGLCNVGEGAAMVRSRGVYSGVMDLMLASSRSMPDYDAAERSFADVGDERLAALEARCPARVPMRLVAAFVRAKAADARRSADGG
jgi:hypothetical protein